MDEGGGVRGGKKEGDAARKPREMTSTTTTTTRATATGKVTFTEDSDAEDEFPEWLAGIPKSDREKRKDKLRKDRERKARVAEKNARLVANLGDTTGGKGGGESTTDPLKTFKVVAGDEDADEYEADAEFNAVVAAKGGSRKVLAVSEVVTATSGGGDDARKRDLIRAGMGKVISDAARWGDAGARMGGGNKGEDHFDVVPQEEGGGTSSRRRGKSGVHGYDEEEEKEEDGGGNSSSSEDSGSGTDEDDDPRKANYDSDEHAELLALGKLLKKHTTRKALLDASYNRYATADDPSTLPAWFASDERQHFRPQLPVSKAEMDAIKARFRDIAARPIAKVVEARARKKRRIGVAMEKAKKTATGIMESEEMGGRAKAKAVAKAYRQAEAKKVGSKYVVSGASGKKTGPKGAAGKRGGKTKVVDPRLKKDKRAIKRKEKSKKGGRRR